MVGDCSQPAGVYLTAVDHDERKDQAMLTAGEFCNRHVVFVHADEPVTVVAQLMREHHVGSVVVVAERAGGRVPLGIVTDRDIAVSLVAVSPERTMTALVSEIVSDKLVVAHDHESVYEVMLHMRGHGVRRMPVVNDAGLLQGIIVLDDLMSYVAEQMSQLVALLEREQSQEERELKAPVRGLDPHLRH